MFYFKWLGVRQSFFLKALVLLVFIFWFGVFPVPRVFSSGGFSSYDFPFVLFFYLSFFPLVFFVLIFICFWGMGGTGMDDRFCGLV